MSENRKPAGIRRGLRVAAGTAAGAGLLLTGLPSVALALPGPERPRNDNIANAENVSTEATGNNDSATAQPGERSHWPVLGWTMPLVGGPHPATHSVWFKWRAPSPCLNKTATIDTEGSDVDTTLAAYTVDNPNHPRVNQVHWPAGYNNLQGDDVDPPDNLTSEVTFTVRQPRWYFIAVDGYTADDTGDFQLHVQCG